MITRRAFIASTMLSPAALIIPLSETGPQGVPEDVMTWWSVPFEIECLTVVTDIGGYCSTDRATERHEALVIARASPDNEPDYDMIGGVLAVCCRQIEKSVITVDGTQVTRTMRRLKGISGDARNYGSKKLPHRMHYQASVIFNLPPAWIEMMQIPNYRIQLTKNVLSSDTFVDVVMTT
jgi:hypothetical protein